MAHRLVGAVRPYDTVCRLGGDEFSVLCRGVADVSSLERAAVRIQQSLAQPFDIGGQHRPVHSSIGCRLATPSDDVESVLRDADVAMYQAKRAGKDRIELFSDETRALILRGLQIEGALRIALDAPLHHGLSLHFQPQVDLVDGRVGGAEALLRWSHPDLGDVSPGEFVAIAEERGLIVQLGQWVLEQACAELAQWQRRFRDFTVTVNVSVHQLADPELVERVRKTISDSGVVPERLCLEVTESALMAAGDRPLAALEQLKQMGLYVAIDDFGTGWSSMSQLKRMPVEVLKVDRAFIQGLGTDPEDTAIVASILSLAHAMGLHVVAEGVETQLQAAELQSLGCTVAQGWLFSRAVPAEELPALVEGGLPSPGTSRSGRLKRALRPHPGMRSRGQARLVDEMMCHVGFLENGR